MVAMTRLMLDQTVARHARLSSDMGRLEEQVATGQRLTRASQDPLAWAQLSDIAREQSALSAAQDALAVQRGRAADADVWLADAVSLFTRAQELMVAAGGPTVDGRPGIVAELTALRTQFAQALDAGVASGQPLLDGPAALKVAAGDGRLLPGTPQRSAVAALPDGRALVDLLDGAIAAAQTGGVALAPALADMASSVSHLALEQARQGIRMADIDRADEALFAKKVSLTERQSALGDTDIAAAITRLQTLSVQRDAARAMLARTNTTLFDLLR